MKQATITLSLSKEHTFTKHNITPIEAMLLVAEHHRNVGDSPVKVDKATITDVVIEREEEKEVTEGTPPVKVKKVVKVKGTRTADEEFDRLKSIYDYRKVDALMSKVRDLPETYEQAVERGLKLTLPSNALSATKGI